MFEINSDTDRPRRCVAYRGECESKKVHRVRDGSNWPTGGKGKLTVGDSVCFVVAGTP